MSTFQRNLVELRESRRLTQKEVAKSVSVKLPTYQSYEEGRCRAPYELLIKIAKYYDITIDDLLTINLTKTNSNKVADVNLE